MRLQSLVLSVCSFFVVLGFVDANRPAQKQVLARLAVAGVHLYQHQIHPYSGQWVHCHLAPSCSRFALNALKQHGIEAMPEVVDRLMLCQRTPAPVQIASTSAVGSLLLQSDQAAGALGCLGCAGFSGFVILVVLGLIFSWIALLVWVVRDSRARAADNPILWMLLVFFFHVLGLVIYLFARPKGRLIPCPNCKGAKLEYARVCPHCGDQMVNGAVRDIAPVMPPDVSFHSPSPLRNCPNCGNQASATARFCNQCGTTF